MYRIVLLDTNRSNCAKIAVKFQCYKHKGSNKSRTGVLDFYNLRCATDLISGSEILRQLIQMS